MDGAKPLPTPMSTPIKLDKDESGKSVDQTLYRASRSFHATGMKRMSEGDLHAEHMYNLDRMRFRKLTTILGVFTVFSICVSVPVVIFQQKKTDLTAEGSMQQE